MLEVRNLAKSYGEKEVLRDINFSLNKGEALGILGSNGAGKTTLLKIICGLINPSYGEVTFQFNKQNQIATVFEDQRFLNHLSGLKNIQLFIRSLSEIESHDWDSAFIKYGLDECKHMKYKFYSTGMKRRLDIMSIFLDPKSLFVLDEPSNGLDIYSMTIFYQTIIKLISDEQKTFIISSHHTTELEKICGRFIIMNKGRILKEIKKEEVMHEYGSLEKAYNSILLEV